MPNDSSTAMKRCDHQVSPICPRWLRACSPPSTAIGLEAGGHQPSAGRPERLADDGSRAARRHQSSPTASADRAIDLAELIGRQLGDPALARSDDPLGQGALRLDHGVDPLLERPPADELADLHVALLTDPEGPVGRLVLHRRVPPPVEVHDVGRRRQVEARCRRPSATAGTPVVRPRPGSARPWRRAPSSSRRRGATGRRSRSR